ncbi:MAG TPA: phosphoribosylglycinamide formyltransferase [Allosphingosinicella sp.]|jgi:formyltetrahydrofolate-dependent phosphoribosylglycinamide formyltransferase
MADPVRVAVLISGRGSNLLALTEHRRRDPERPYAIVLVASNVPHARGLILAKRLGIPSWSQSHEGHDRADFDELVEAALVDHEVELVALAGYMRLLSTQFVERWRGRILNIHPSLLPLHKGLDTHRRALLAGDTEAGCSVHVVTPDLDSGPVIAQARVRISARDTVETLEERVLAEEHRLYPLALEGYAEALRQGKLDIAPLPHA